MSSRSAVCKLILLLILIVLTGCDLTGEYENRRQASLALVAKQSSVTKHLGQAVTIADDKGATTKISFSPPKILEPQPEIDKIYNALKGVKKYDFMGTKGKGPMLYVCVLPLSVGTIDQVVQTVDTAVRTISPEFSITVGDLQMNAVDDKPQNFVFKRLTVQGKHQFSVPDAGGTKAEDLSGTIDIFIVAGPQHYVAFAFRVADDSPKKADLAEVMNASMRSVSIAP